MTLKVPARYHVNWNDREELIKILEQITEHSKEDIEEAYRSKRRSSDVIKQVLETSEKPFMQSLDPDRGKTIVTFLGEEF